MFTRMYIVFLRKINMFAEILTMFAGTHQNVRGKSKMFAGRAECWRAEQNVGGMHSVLAGLVVTFFIFYYKSRREYLP